MKQYAASNEPSPDAPKGPGGRPCLLCEYAHYEVGLAQKEGRVVYKNEHWVSLVPWWAVWPFEVLMLPYKRHIPSILELTAEEKSAWADCLSNITKRYDNLFQCSFAYSMGIHQRPLPLKPGQSANAEDVAHLHLHFAPPLLRSASIRKFLVGFELMAEPQRDLTAEQAAKRLRDLPDVHYLDIETQAKEVPSALGTDTTNS